jgi:putative ABC transport system permease protein
VLGTTAAYVPMHNYTMTYGRMFTDGDDQARQRYAVLGASVPEMLGGNPAAMIHQTMLIRGIPFEIIGVLSSKGAAGGFFNPDEQILIPIQTAQFRIYGTKRIRSLSVQVADGVPVEQGMVDLERVMRREHKIRPGADNDFQVRNQQDFLATQQQATQVFTSLLASIAAVSLIVGGIGIMNIMLVSVTERTREIGLRMAVGARSRDILLQFLVEAVTLALIGGAIGIVIGGAGSYAVGYFAGWRTEMSVTAVVLAVGFAGAVGVFFGFYPARTASRLVPIEALRHE